MCEASNKRIVYPMHKEKERVWEDLFNEVEEAIWSSVSTIRRKSKIKMQKEMHMHDRCDRSSRKCISRIARE